MQEQITKTVPLADVEDVNGMPHMRDRQNRLVPLETIHDRDLLEDQLVRGIVNIFQGAQAELKAIRVKAIEEIQSFQNLMAEKHGIKRGGKKGNLQYTSFNGAYRVSLDKSDVLELNSDLELAETLIDGLLEKWMEGSCVQLKSVVNKAFNRNPAGGISAKAVLGLKSLKIEDPEWQEAMGIISNAVRIGSTREYVRVYRRNNVDGWDLIPLDIAKV
ncbi:DUF3164 family protein [Desulfovibrio sp. OttesenSCG-928-G15]|nr:DUF3164 family protein [Desulfovibrio sp. OttesenSCG-928-G15]